MIYKKDYFGYVYEWKNNKNGMKYIGSHYGSINDSYKGSNIRFLRTYKKNPNNFEMKVLEYLTEDNKKYLLEKEQYWLNTIYNIKDNPLYYNLKNEATGGWSFISKKLIKKRANSLVKRQKKYGLSNKEKKSYKIKTETKKERWKKFGFSKSEQEQHLKYGYTIKVIYPSGKEKIFTSYTKATKECGIDIKYCINNKNGIYKEFKAYILSKPKINCSRWKNE